MQIRLVPFSHPDAVRLVEEVQQEYVGLYGGRDDSPVDAHEFDEPAGAFFVGYDDGVPVATGAWRRTSLGGFDAERTAEIKRMYVAAAARRRGLAREMLAHLEQTAQAAGIDTLVLETGTAQPEAIALYASSDYAPVEGFGHYRDSPLSRCFARDLRAQDRRTWDDEAARFDEEPDHGLGAPETREAWRRLLLDALPPAPARVLDLGCGTGTLSVLLAEAGHAVTGLDFSPPMLELARAKATAAGVPVELVTGDAAAPTLPGSTYDVVLCRHVLWAMTDPSDALRRWAALLAPGGLLVLVEGFWHTGAGLHAVDTVALLAEVGRTAQVRPMPEAVYWGAETGDERYLVSSPAS